MDSATAGVWWAHATEETISKKKRKLTTLCVFFSALSCKRPPRCNPAESLRSRAPWERFASGLQQAIVSAFLRDGFGGQLQHLLSICSHSPLTSLQPPPAPPKKKTHPCTLAPFHYLLLSSPIFPLSHLSGNTVAGRAQWTATQKRKEKKPPETIDLVSCIWPSSPAGTKYHHL